ncbi:uncharacterized protein MYCFIDRAFT_18376, partial [Pseudocercospora fijiensis CIRAD86]
LLHLFHHRNKNQHRRSHWYKHMNTFRRQLQSLLSDLKTLNSVPSTHTSARLEFWREVMVSKWQFAFSQVVADGRFSVLGVFLYSCLAEVGKLVGMTGMLEEL